MMAVMFWLALSGAGSALPAASGSIPAPPGRDAKSIARALEAHYRSAATLKAAFLERYSEGRQSIRIESGTVYFSRPGRMRWEYESPEEKLFVADGKTVWFYVPADRTVTRARMKESADWRTPLALLTGKAKLSHFCARIELAGERLAAAGHVVLRCLLRGASPARTSSPTSAPGLGDESIHEVLLEVNTARDELVRVLIRQPGGVEIEYRFGNWQENLPLSEGMFHFQAPAGVAIVDEAAMAGPSH